MPNAEIQSDHLLAARVRIPEHVVHRSFVAETVVLNLSTGKYHSMNPTAGRMLDLLKETGSVQESAQRLSDESGVQLERVTDDLVTLCINMTTRGLIETEPAGA